MKALWLLPPVRRNLKSSKPTQRTSPKGLGEVFSEFHEIALARIPEPVPGSDDDEVRDRAGFRDGRA